MKSFIVIGMGRFGTSLALALQEQGSHVLGIDKDYEIIQHLSEKLTHAVAADASDENVLKSLGVKDFDCAIVSLSKDIQASVLVTLILKELGVDNIIAKANSNIHMKLLKKVGANTVIFPEHDMGIRLARSLSRQDIIEYIELSKEIGFIERKVPDKWIGKSLIELNLRKNYNFNVIAIKNSATGEISISIKPDEPLTSDDILFIVGSEDSFEKLDK